MASKRDLFEIHFLDALNSSGKQDFRFRRKYADLTAAIEGVKEFVGLKLCATEKREGTTFLEFQRTYDSTPMDLTFVVAITPSRTA